MDNNEMNRVPQQEQTNQTDTIFTDASQPTQEPTPQTETPVVKDNSHLGLKILLVILVIAVIVLSGYFVYNKFIATDNTPKTTDKTSSKDKNEKYVGYYSGCSKNSEGTDICSELVLNEDKTAYLLINPISAAAVVGTYNIDDDNIIINSTYELASENSGKNVEKYNLKIDGNTIIYNFDVETINMSFKLTKTTKEKLNLYNQMDKGEIALNQTDVTTNTEYNVVKKLFVNEYLLNPEAEKLLDYRIEEIKVLSGDEKEEIVNMGYQSTDILANVRYSVKVNNPTSSSWLAGNGEGAYGKWLFGKSAVVAIRDGKLNNVGTGW